MAGFLRKKSKKDASPTSSPLFTRPPAPDDPQRVAVSGPMSLTAARKDSASVRFVRQAAPPAPQSRRRSANAPPPSSYEQPRGGGYSSDHGHAAGSEVKDARHLLPAQQPLAPVSHPAGGDPYTAYRRSFRAPQPARPDNDRPVVDTPPQQPHGPSAEPNSGGPIPSPTVNPDPVPSLIVDNEDRHSFLIDLPPEIALFQVSFPWIAPPHLPPS
jgi:hypothetical protein